MILIPQPQTIKLTDINLKLSPDMKIILDISCDFNDMESAKLLQNEIKEVIGFKFAITKTLLKDYFQGILLKKTDLKQNNKEAYQIHVTENGVEILAQESAGLLYGVQTLRQIIRMHGAVIPGLIIDDAPYYAARGFYHDVTRGKVPTLATLKELADRAAFYKINQLQLYVEHTFAFKKQSEVWIGSDPLTAEEILLFDEYCKKRNIELVPSFSTFGHLYYALSSNSFHTLCELDNGLEDPYSWMGQLVHHTLDVSNPKSFDFVANMLDEVIPLFTSDKFNICCDETFDLGKGKNKEKSEQVGVGRLYVDFVKKIINHVKRYNKQPMFWADIALQYPEFLNELPDDVICLNWDYAEEPKEENIKTLSEAGLQQYLCSGVWGWSSLVNNSDIAFSNIQKLAHYGKKYGALGILNTNWGNCGHVNLFATLLPGLIYGACQSWYPDDLESFSSIDEKISKLEFGDASGKIVDLFRQLGRTKKLDWWHIICWKDYRLQKIDSDYNANKIIKEFTEQDLVDSYENIIKISDDILKLSSAISVDRKLELQELYIAARGVALLQALGLMIKKYDMGQQTIKDIYTPEQLASMFEYWFYDFTIAWRARNKESELYRVKDAVIEMCDFLRKI